MNNRKSRICPVEKSKSLDNKFRRWLQNPKKILKPYIKKGMTVLDLGCGPGFFTIDIAEMVGDLGHVIALDMQEGMLEKVNQKIHETKLKKRITLHKSQEDTLGMDENVDFILTFYMVHEIPNQENFFREIVNILNKNGLILIVEPIFHVSKKSFIKTIEIAQKSGLTLIEAPSIFFSRTAALKKG